MSDPIKTEQEITIEGLSALLRGANSYNDALLARLETTEGELEKFQESHAKLIVDYMAAQEWAEKCEVSQAAWQEHHGAALREVADLKEHLAALRICFAEASHNAGPAFMAHEELKRLREELAAESARVNYLETHSEFDPQDAHWRIVRFPWFYFQFPLRPEIDKAIAKENEQT